MREGFYPYAYCDGDPINRVDPSGHLSWQAGLGIGLGVIGLTFAVFSAGASIAATDAVSTAIETASAMFKGAGKTLGVAADVAGIARGALADANPQASATLGWISLGLGGPGAVSGLVTAARAGKKLIFGLVRAAVKSDHKVRCRELVIEIHLRGTLKGGPPHFQSLSKVTVAPKSMRPSGLNYWHKVSQKSPLGYQHVFRADRQIFGYEIRDPIEFFRRRPSIIKTRYSDYVGYLWSCIWRQLDKPRVT